MTLVADFYVVLFDAIRKNPGIGHGREGFYFVVNGEHTLYELGKAVSQALVDLGKGKSAEPTTFTKVELDTLFGPVVSTVLVCFKLYCSSCDPAGPACAVDLWLECALRRQPIEVDWMEASQDD